MRTIRTTAAALLLILSGVGDAGAQDTIAQVLTFDGLVEIERDGERIGVERGDDILGGDIIHTGEDGSVAILFNETDSVVHLAPGSSLTVFPPEIDALTEKWNTLLRLLKGTVRTIVTEYYSDPLARFEVLTATAMTGVRGTDFVVLHDVETEVTEVVGWTGSVEVTSTRDPQERSVVLAARQATTVKPGEAPTPPRPIDDDEFRQLIQGIELIGAASSENLSSRDTVAKGQGVPAPDRAAGAPAASPAPETEFAPTEGSSTITEPEVPVLPGAPAAPTLDGSLPIGF